MLRIDFLLPTVDNDKRPLDKLLKETEATIVQAFGGLSKVGKVDGYWTMKDGSVAQETNNAYFLVIQQNQFNTLVQILRRFKRVAKQEAIFIEKRQATTELI